MILKLSSPIAEKSIIDCKNYVTISITRNNILKVCFFLLIVLITNQSFSQSGIDIVRGRIRGEIINTKIDDQNIKSIISSLKSDGSWPGINYNDVSGTGFEHGRHLGNLVKLSIAYNQEKSQFYHHKELKKAVDSALNFWLKKDFICANWWWNQIGTPTSLSKVLLAMDSELSKEQVDKLLPILGRANLNASGARPSGDRIMIAGILAKKLLFLRDKKRFDDVIKEIEGEIKFATGRGMQCDYSFHHRPDRVNTTFSYGRNYANTFAQWAAYVAKTEYAFSDEKINQLIDFYLDGICKQLIYGKYRDPGTRNKGVSRKVSPLDSSTPKKLITTTDYRKNELLEIIDIRDNNVKTTLSFAKFFWQSEHFVFQRPDFYTSVRMYSTRNKNIEYPYYGEGLLNHHKGDGANFISLDGTEYKDIWAMYDWQKIPGTTVMQKPSLPSEKEIQKAGLTDFVGAVTDSLYGVVAFDFRSPHDPLAAKKSWFFFEEEYVCLGTGISAEANLPVATTINQCLLRGDVIVSKEGNRKKLMKGEYSFQKADWIYHDGIGYVFPEQMNVELENKEACGSLYRINRHSNIPKKDICADVFKLWIDHGKKPDNASYHYMVVPATTAKQLRKDPQDRNIRVLSNTSAIQAVIHDQLDICQIIFYKAGSVEISKGLTVNAKVPGIVMLKMGKGKVKKISVSDPGRKLKEFSLSITQKLRLSSEGTSLNWDKELGQSNLNIVLPQDGYAGESVSISF